VSTEIIAQATTDQQAPIDARRIRGLEIAATRRIHKTQGGWIVPSQRDANDKYTVTADSCTCPDHTTRGVRCKHIFAVEYVIQREIDADARLRRPRV
jgi:hypothetical protein